MIEVRPWGSFIMLYQDEDTWLKKLIIAPGQSLSLQRHKERDEYWYPLDDGVVFSDSEHEIELISRETYFCLRGANHRLSNPGHEPVRVIEWATGSPDESDIVRIKDNYGRARCS